MSKYIIEVDDTAVGGLFKAKGFAIAFDKDGLDKLQKYEELVEEIKMENMTVEQIELIAYKLIRREVNKFDHTTTDSELGNYVRGVVQMQTELYSLQVSQSDHT